MVTKRNVPVDLCRAPRGYSSRTSLSPCPKQQLSAVDSALSSSNYSKLCHKQSHLAIQPPPGKFSGDSIGYERLIFKKDEMVL
ncbi:unnamed protein product [Arctogadus glacialis]